MTKTKIKQETKPIVIQKKIRQTIKQATLQKINGKIKFHKSKSHFSAGFALLAVGAILLFYFDPVFAQSSKLTQAAQNTSNMVTTIAQVTSGIGIIAGGILMSLGQSQIGKTVLGGGIFGAILSFGGPAILGTIREIFR